MYIYITGYVILRNFHYNWNYKPHLSVISRKLSWRSHVELRTCHSWENNELSSNTWPGAYWQRVKVVCDGNVSRIMTIIWALHLVYIFFLYAVTQLCVPKLLTRSSSFSSAHAERPSVNRPTYRITNFDLCRRGKHVIIWKCISEDIIFG